MNAPANLGSVVVRGADLEDAADRARIDAFVRAHDRGTPFHLTSWGVAVARGCGQTAHCLVAERRDGMVAGILPLTEVRSALFGRAMVSAGFAVGGGVLAVDGRAAIALMEAGWALAEAAGCPSVELRGPAPADPAWTATAGTYVNFAAPLADSDEAQLLAIPRKQRAEIRRSLGFDLAVETGSGPRDRAAHYAVYSESVRNLGTPVFPRALFGAVLDAFGDDADILTVRKDGAPIASVLTLYHRGIAMPYWGGGTHSARRWRANDHLYFALMRHARNRGCTRFDFGRSKLGTGAYAFKKNWGFEPEPLTYAVRTADGAAPRDVNPLSPKYRLQVAAWQKLPLWLANRIGPAIARGLG